MSNIFDTNVLVGLVPNLKTSQNWLLDRFFTNVVTYETEEVSIDVDIGQRRMSPFVSPLVEGKLVESRKYQTNTFKPAYIKDKRAPDLRKPIRRQMGERIGGEYTAAEREQLNVMFEMEDQIDMLSRRLEWMAASALASAIEARTELPVTVVHTGEMVSEGAIVVLSAKNKGAHGNTIDLRLNYLGSAGGETTPDSMVLTLTPMTGGAGAPEMDDALANLQDRTFDFIINPYADTASLNKIKEFLSDSTGRWSYAEQLYGHSFAAQSGTYGQLTAAGELRNDQHASLLGINGSPTPSYVWSAAYVGAIAQSLRNDPGRPLQTLAISGVLAPPLASRFTLTERNNLLHSGISTVTTADDGTVQVENIITTYQKNKYGAEDDSYLQIETLFLLMFVTRFLRTQVTSKFARMKLAADGTRFAPGSAIITPNVIRAELIAQYQTLEFNGYVQDAKGFARGLIVEKSASNPNRVDVLWTGVLINQLRIFAVLNQFRLQASA